MISEVYTINSNKASVTYASACEVQNTLQAIGGKNNMAIVYNLFISLLAIMWTHIDYMSTSLALLQCGKKFLVYEKNFFPLRLSALQWELKLFFVVLVALYVRGKWLLFLCSDAIIRPMTDENSEVIVMKSCVLWWNYGYCCYLWAMRLWL